MGKYYKISIILALVFIAPSNGGYYRSWTVKRMKGKILTLISELVIDANRRVENVQFIRQMYYNTHIFQNGELVYDLRKKYRRMRQCYERSLFVHRNKKVELMTEIHGLSYDIGQIIDMFIEDRNKHQSRSERHDNYKLILRNHQKQVEEDKRRKIALRENMKKIGKKIQPDDEQKRLKSYQEKDILEGGFDTDQN